MNNLITKTKLAVTMLLIGMFGAPAAQAEDMFYVGPKIGYMMMEVSCPAGTGGTGCASPAILAGLTGGFNLLGNKAAIPLNLAGGTLAVEIEATKSLTDFSSSGSSGGITWDTTFNTTTTGAYVAYRYPFNNKFYAAVRLGKVTFERSGQTTITNIGTTVTPISDSTSVTSYGLSGGVNMGPGSLRLDLTSYDSGNVSAVNIGYMFAF